MKPCSLIFLVTLLCGTFELNAQENLKKSFYVISPGYIVYDKGQQSAISFSNEYIRNIHKHFACGARLTFSHGESRMKARPPQYNSYIATTGLDINGFYKPFKSDKHILLLGVGIAMDYTRISVLSDTGYFVINDKIYTTANNYSALYFIEPVFALHYYYNFNKNLYLGVNINARRKPYQFAQYVSGIEYMTGIGFGVKF